MPQGLAREVARCGAFLDLSRLQPGSAGIHLSFPSKRHAPVCKVSVSFCRPMYDDLSSKSRDIRRDSTFFFSPLLRDRPQVAVSCRGLGTWLFFMREGNDGNGRGTETPTSVSLSSVNTISIIVVENIARHERAAL